MKRRDEKLFETFVFLVKLNILVIPLYLIIWLGVDLTPLQNFLASQIFQILQFFGVSVKREGLLLLFDNFSLVVAKDCIGWKSMVFYFALLVSTKATWKQRGIGMLVGIPLIYAINLSRILILVFLGLYMGIEAFDFFHNFLWQIFMIITIVILWILWNKKKIIIN